MRLDVVWKLCTFNSMFHSSDNKALKRTEVNSELQPALRVNARHDPSLLDAMTSSWNCRPRTSENGGTTCLLTMRAVNSVVQKLVTPSQQATIATLWQDPDAAACRTPKTR